MKSYMILSLIVCFAAARVLAQAPINITAEQRIKFKQDFNECIKQENVNAEDVRRLQKWNVQNATTQMKCLITCFFERFGALEDNKVQEQAALPKITEILGEERAKELLRRWRNTEATTERCDTGFKMFEVLWSYQAF